MRIARRVVAGALGLGYWVSATIVLGAAWLALAASEEPPFTEEKRLFWLAFPSWILASAVVHEIVRGRNRAVLLLAAWAIQASLLVSGFFSTVEAHRPFHSLRIDPPLIAIGIAGQLAGIAAIAARPPRRPRQS